MGSIVDYSGSFTSRHPYQSVWQAQLQHKAASTAIPGSSSSGSSSSCAWATASTILQAAQEETAILKSLAAQQAATIKEREATISSLQLSQVGLTVAFTQQLACVMAKFATELPKLQELQQQQHDHQLQQQQDTMQHRLSMCGAALTEIQRLRSADAEQVQQLQAANFELEASNWNLQQQEAQLLQHADSLQHQAADLQRKITWQQQQMRELASSLEQQEGQLQRTTAAAAAAESNLQLVTATAADICEDLSSREDVLMEQVDTLSDQVSVLQQQLSEQLTAAAACATPFSLHENDVFEQQLGDSCALEPGCVGVAVVKEGGQVFYVQQTARPKVNPPVLQLNAMYAAQDGAADDGFMCEVGSVVAEPFWSACSDGQCDGLHSCCDSHCSICGSSDSSSMTGSVPRSNRSSTVGASGGIGRYSLATSSCSSLCSSLRASKEELFNTVAGQLQHVQ